MLYQRCLKRVFYELTRWFSRPVRIHCWVVPQGLESRLLETVNPPACHRHRHADLGSGEPSEVTHIEHAGLPRRQLLDCRAYQTLSLSGGSEVLRVRAGCGKSAIAVCPDFMGC